MTLATVRSRARTAAAVAATSWVGNRPATVVAGDALLALVYVAGAKATALPAGWEELTTASISGQSLTLYRKQATGSEPESYTWTGGSRSVIVDVLAIADAASSGWLSSVASGATRTVWTAPSITTTKTDTLLVTAAQGGPGGTPWASPAGYAELEDSASTGTSTCSGALAVKDQPTAGATGAPAWTANATTSGGALLVAIPSVTSNTSPTVDAGPHQNVHEGELVTLTAVQTDPEGGVVGVWVQEFGPVVTLADPTAAVTTFTAPLLPGVLAFRRDVIDPVGLAGTDRVTVCVQAVDELVWTGSAWT